MVTLAQVARVIAGAIERNKGGNCAHMVKFTELQCSKQLYLLV